ncbi:hypothetical protein [Clostridium senegalense]|uniref:hypothetical protein n=1 Tax=Clostridium senegalense TaxID=1465809 RepID=UPI0002890872|nr:hypothetical protein [Clostridium senegalense]
MASNYKMKKNGFAMISVIIITGLVITIASYMICENEFLSKYYSINNEYLVNQSEDEKQREILLGKANKYILNSKESLEKLKFTYDNASIKYDKDEELLVLIRPYDIGTIKKTYYRPKLNKNKVNFIFIKDKLERG